MERVELSVAPQLTSMGNRYFNSPAIMEVDTADGRLLAEAVYEMRGHPKNPVSANAIEAKFMECAERVLGREGARRTLDLVGQLERLDDVRELMAALRPVAREQASAPL